MENSTYEVYTGNSPRQEKIPWIKYNSLILEFCFVFFILWTSEISLEQLGWNKQKNLTELDTAKYPPF